MDDTQRQHIIETITSRERLRGMSRFRRLLADPIRAFPFYLLALRTRIKPFKRTFPTLWGTSMTSYLPEGNTFLYYGYCEANLTNFLLRYLQAGRTFIDVGAHVGFYTMLASKLVADQGQVHSFEPTPWTYDLLAENTGSMANVTRNNLAISDKEGSIEFSDYGPGFGAYNTSDEKGAPALHKTRTLVKVKTITLDSYCREHSLTPDFIKLDAEGAEHLILEGMTNVLSIQRPLISLEVAGDAQWGSNRKDSFAILTKCQYSPFEIRPNGTISAHAFRNTYEYDNLIFVPNERINSLLMLTEHPSQERA